MEPESPSLSFYSFPKDQKLAREWIVKIRRDIGPHFQVNEHTKVCSLHFEANAYCSGTRKRPEEKKLTSLTHRKLKRDAVPTKFFWNTTTIIPTFREALPPCKIRKVGDCPEANGDTDKDVDEEVELLETDEVMRTCEDNEQYQCTETDNVKLCGKCEDLEKEIHILRAECSAGLSYI